MVTVTTITEGPLCARQRTWALSYLPNSTTAWRTGDRLSGEGVQIEAERVTLLLEFLPDASLYISCFGTSLGLGILEPVPSGGRRVSVRNCGLPTWNRR